ncbi:MAG: sugar phosphate isomerase/epimerase [Bryobacterales bacterium]|nr:sugar phosphate isomerase/epimerase [Bryobacterales bacterium]MBV9397035.1 sugar phosphate isomerase/epimerase [Bryobacterales bacterium]
MLVGAMNHPAAEVISEIRWMAEMGLDFIDLTLEPPAAAACKVNPAQLRNEIEKHGLKVVGHTAFYLPFASAFESIREAALGELKLCLEVFAEVGAHWMNLHPDHNTPMHPRSYFVQRNIVSITELMEPARKCGVGLMIENLPGEFNTAQQLGELLDPIPELGLHLDIGHANLLVPHNMTQPILNAYGDRVRHVHLHDNRGGSADLHLGLGCGNVDVRAAIRELKTCGYDGTITLEVFSPDREYLRYSRDILRRLWGEIAPLKANVV